MSDILSSSEVRSYSGDFLLELANPLSISEDEMENSALFSGTSSTTTSSITTFTAAS